MLSAPEDLRVPASAEMPVAEIRSYFSQRAGQIDEGTADIREGLRFLASRGLLGHRDLAVQCAAISEVASSCLASAFSAWAQCMVIEYLAGAKSRALQAQTEKLRRAELMGSTAMAPAFQEAAGLGQLPTCFRREGQEVVLEGKIRWASNLFPDGFLVVVAARSEDSSRAIVAVPSDAPGLQIGAPLKLLALGATASSSLSFKDVHVGLEGEVADDLPEFLARVKPRFLALQTAFCLGLAEGSLRAIAPQLRGVLARYATQHLDLLERLQALNDSQARAIQASGPTPKLLENRLLAADLAQKAVALELRTTGGAGYLAASDTARRLREASFLPIQSPTEGQLLWELASSAS